MTNPEKKATVRRHPKKTEFYKLRLKLGLSVESVSEMTGVTTHTVKNWDKNDSSDLAKAYLRLWDKKHLTAWGDDWKGFYFSRGVLCYGRSMRFLPRTLQQVDSWLAVYNRVESAKVRYLMDGISQQEAIAIAFGCLPAKNSRPHHPAQSGMIIQL